MRIRTYLFFCLTVGALSVASLDAAAQSADGAFQLGLSTPVFGYSSGTLEYETPVNDTEADVSATVWGLRNAFSLELGYGLSDAVIIGVLASIGGQSTTTELDVPGAEESETSSTNVSIGPKIDLQFGRGSLQPFVGATIAFQSSSSETEAFEQSLTGFDFGARAGLRWFVAPGLSIDPALAASWSTASGEAEVLDLGDADVSSSAFNVGLMLGLSGWIR